MTSAHHLSRTDIARPAGGFPVDLAGNDYLGLARHPDVLAAAHNALDTWGVGSAGSRVVAGTTTPHHQCEAALAEFLGFPAALLFSSGYLANLAAITAFCTPETILLCDRRNHASLIDACRLTTARRTICDVTHPAELTAHLTSEHPTVVVCDVVDSTNGTALDIPAIYHHTHAAGALLIADMAHGLGTLGAAGKGPFPHLIDPASSGDLIITCTLSKALGSQGGAVLCTPEQRQHLVNTARSFIFDTALAPALAAAATAALQVLVQEPQRVVRLHRVMDVLADGLEVPRTPSAVLALPLGDPARALAAQQYAAQQGVHTGCFRPPSVSWENSGLRVGGRADLQEEQCAQAITALHKAVAMARRGGLEY